MSKIVLFLPGNLFHSNVIQKQMPRLLAEKAGMDTLRKCGVPIVFGWQMIDWLLAEDEDIYDPGLSHELCAGSYSHVLHSLLSDEDSIWQMANGINADWKKEKRFKSIDVTFYPEFAPPSNPEVIQTDYFLLYGPDTRYYDYDEATGDLSVWKDISNIQAVQFVSKSGIQPVTKIGILIGNSDLPIRDKWHDYQKNPGKGLGPLVDATKRVADQDGPVHITWLDVETPYVEGNSNAGHLWLDYFEALKDTVKAFSPLQPHLEWFKKRAVDVGAPHRLLGKWTQHDAQLAYVRRAFYNIQAQALSEPKHLCEEQRRKLLAVARSSDVLSVMDSRIRVQEKEEPSYRKKHREEILKLGVTCLNILEGKEESLESLSKADPILGPRLVKILGKSSDQEIDNTIKMQATC